MKHIRIFQSVLVLLCATVPLTASAEPYWVEGHWAQRWENGDWIEEWIDEHWEDTEGYTWVEGYWVEDWENGVLVGEYWVDGHWELLP